jgi:glycosyltransferase involved in cell wall biosynthesis
MKLLFIHQNFPGQFKHLARHYGQNGQHDVRFITQRKEIEIPGVTKLLYKPHRTARKETHHYLHGMENAVLHGQAVAKVCEQLRQEGFIPDVVVAHPGWGEALYIKDIFPNTPLLNYFEFYFHSSGGDVGFDPNDQPDLNSKLKIRTRNALHLLNLECCDAGLSPTTWQKIQHPPEFQHKISVIHEGVDTNHIVADKNAQITLGRGGTFTRQDEIITYVSRNLEPYRGFETFMRALEIICRNRPNAHILIVGGDETSYGKRLQDGQTYRQKMLAEVKVDLNRVHFLGRVPYNQFLNILQVSSAHIYLTYPFVLSWSMLEAMSASCLVIGSKTPPVEEVITHNENGLLVDFFSPQQVADAVDKVFEHPDRYQALRDNARKTILEQYALKDCLPKQYQLIESLATE